MKIVFMGTPDFAAVALQALVNAGHEVAAVYTQPPRPAGRGKADRKSSVHQLAEVLGLDVRHPVSLKGDEARAAFDALASDLAVVAAYGLLLPQAVLDAPEHGCLNIHASLLPRWRGAAPIQRAIMAGDETTGVCIMQMGAGLDTGPVRHVVTTPIAPDETAATLHDRLAQIGARAIVDVVGDLSAYPPVEQPQEGATYASKIDKAEARIDWSLSAAHVDRLIRGLSPFPGAWCEIADERVKVLHAQTDQGQGTPGEVLDDAFRVACGTGVVRILRAQRAGRGAVDAATFLRGFPVPKGTRLS